MNAEAQGIIVLRQLPSTDADTGPGAGQTHGISRYQAKPLGHHQQHSNRQSLGC